MTQPTAANKIYLTAKTRMVSEAKIRAKGKALHILIAWYSFCLIVLSLGEITNRYQVASGGLLSIALSIGLFALSLYTYGEKYHERAEQFRSCYLQLQELYNRDLALPRKMAEYARILEQFENQRDDDYDDMLFDAWVRNQKLENAHGPVAISFLSGAKVVIRRLVRLGILAALFLAPAVLAIEFAKPNADASSPVGDNSQVVVDGG